MSCRMQVHCVRCTCCKVQREPSDASLVAWQGETEGPRWLDTWTLGAANGPANRTF
jgi:hypothetical protein